MKKNLLLIALASSIALAGPPTGPLSVPANAQAELDKALADTWKAVKPTLDGMIDKEVTKLAGTKHGKLSIDSLTLAKIDTASPPRLTITPLTAGQHHFLFFKWGKARYDGEKVRIDLPKDKWTLELKGHVQYDLKVLFIHHHFSEDVTLNVEKLHASEEIELDTTDPTLPVCKKTGNIQLDYDLDVHTSSFLVNAVLFVFHPLIDHFLNKAIGKALSKIDAEIGTLKGLPSKSAWGAGAPARAPFGSQPDLEKAALAASDDLQSTHTPYGGVLEAWMSDPTYGKGTPTSHGGFGDSAIWTGHYLAGEAFRFAITKDPKAQANAARAIAAITDMLDAETPGGGHLARCVIPAGSVDAPAILADPDSFTTTIRGQSVVCLAHISRDQYLGVMHGLGCAYDFLDDPATKKQCADLMGRVVDYLVANGWVAMNHDNVTMSAPFVQSPDKMIAFTALAAHADPAKYQPLRDEVGQLAWAAWVFGLDGSLDPLSSYYKWNLGEGTIYHAMRLETDPARFMALERAHAIDHRTIASHENAYFQTIDAAVDPTTAAAVAPQVLDELRRLVARGRRGFTVTNSTDPAIAKGTYSVPLSFSSKGSTPSLAPKTTTEALYAIPVEKRPPTDFLWQRDPFQLDGSMDPKWQPPGVDIVLPYWMARYYKLVP